MMFEQCKRLLGQPYFEMDGCLIFNLDSLEAMRSLVGIVPDSLDLTVTSPPYNIGKEYEEKRALEEYLAWTEAWIKLVHELTKPHGAFWLNLGYIGLPDRARAIPIPYLLWERVPFYLIQEVVWNYGAGVAAKTMFSPRNEKFLWYVKQPKNYTFNLDLVRDKEGVRYPNSKKNGRIRVNPFGKNPTDVWQIPKVTSGKNRSSKERTPHPAQFPVQVIDRIIKATSNPGEVIFDPFLGSGSTAVVALTNNRKVIGFEINRSYCEIAVKRLHRLRDKNAQRNLF
jgi:adenine-specific DNA-methyltransferase